MSEFHGTREAFASAILELAQTDDRVMFVSPDSLKAMRATQFAQLYPEQYIEVGISEQSAVDIAAGLASAGLVPFVGTYAGFLTMRACEQMRTFVAYPNLGVKFVGINAGLLGGEREGVTHQFYEDICILSAMPGFSIFSPADGNQAYHAVKLAAKTDGPVYVRAGSGREPDVFKKSDPFSTSGVTVLRDWGEDILLLSTGGVLDRVLAAGELLQSRRIHSSVADVNILYGKETSSIVALMDRFNRIVTVEDHNVNGGLGSFISKLACENTPMRVKRIGLETFGESGPAKELADQYGYSPENIAAVAAGILD